MHLKKNLGRIATAFVVTAMLASLTAVPASADAQPGEFTTITGGKITMTKKLEMPADVVVPGITFTFDIDAATAGDGEQYTSGDVTLPVKDGVGTREGAGTATISANQDTTPSGNNKVATATVELTLPEATYPEAGVYKYTIDEQAVDTTAGYTDKTDSLDLYLIVTRKNADQAIDNESDPCSVTAAFITKAGDKDTKTAEWLNYYKLTEDGQSKVGTITVQKLIAGAMGNKSDEFVFTIGGLKDDVDYTYTINETEKTGVLNTSTTESNKVTLGHGDTLKVIGLEDGTEITITEAATNGYECTKVTNDSNEDPTDGNVLEVAAGETKDTVFTNSREAVSPTGIVMDVAPYALLVVVAAAGCFVFLRKRRED